VFDGGILLLLGATENHCLCGVDELLQFLTVAIYATANVTSAKPCHNVIVRSDCVCVCVCVYASRSAKKVVGFCECLGSDMYTRSAPASTVIQGL